MLQAFDHVRLEHYVEFQLPRYYIPPQYYPFLKKLGDDTPELKRRA